MTLLFRVADRAWGVGDFEGFSPMMGTVGWVRGEFGRVMGGLWGGMESLGGVVRAWGGGLLRAKVLPEGEKGWKNR